MREVSCESAFLTAFKKNANSHMAAYNVANYSGHKNEHLDWGWGGVRGSNARAHARSRPALLTQRIHTH